MIGQFTGSYESFEELLQNFEKLITGTANFEQMSSLLFCCRASDMYCLPGMVHHRACAINTSTGYGSSAKIQRYYEVKTLHK